MKVVKQLLFLFIYCVVSQANAQISAIAGLDHINPIGNDTLGGIILTTSGGQPPLSYEWKLDGMTTVSTSKDLNNAKRGYYSIVIKDALGAEISYYYNLEYKAIWTDLNGVASRNDSLIAGGAGLIGSPSARSFNILGPNKDGGLDFVVQHAIDLFFVGFVNNATADATGSTSDVEFAVYSTYGNLYAFINNSLTHIGYMVNGDLISVQRIGAFYYVALNGQYIYSIATNPAKALKVKALLSDPLINVGCSFADSSSGKPMKVKPVIDHIKPDGISSTGNILLNLSGGTTPYDIQWSPGNVKDQNLLNVSRDLYAVQITDGTPDNLELAYRLGYRVKWNEAGNVLARNDSLVMSGSSPGCRSANVLPQDQDGWAEMICGEFVSPFIIGFIDADKDFSPTHLDLDFSFHITYGNTLYAWYGGNFIYLGTVQQGDAVRLERNAGYFSIVKNNVKLYSVDANNAAMKLKAYLDGSIPIHNFGCSFMPGFNASLQKNAADYTHQYNGAVSIYPYGGTKPYTVRWADNQVLSSRSDLIPGRYLVTISDSLKKDSLQKYIDIGIKPSWKITKNLAFSSDTIIKPTADSLGISIAENIIDVNKQGALELKINQADHDIAIGFIGTTTGEREAERLDLLSEKAIFAYELMKNSIDNKLPYDGNTLKLSSEYDAINMIRLNKGNMTILMNNSEETARFSYQVDDVIKVGRGSEGKISVAINDAVVYDHPVNANALYLSPAILVNTHLITGTPEVLQGLGGDPPPVFIPPVTIFARPANKLDGGFYTAISGKVYFAVEGEYNTSTLKFKVYNNANTAIMTNGVGNYLNYVTQDIGDNRRSLNVGNLANGFYVLEITNEKNEKQYLRFKQYISTGTGTGTANQN